MSTHIATDRLTRDDVARIYATPLLELVMQAATVHRAHHDPQQIQCSSLLSIKTGACPEDCAYCPQSARYATDSPRESLMDLGDVVATAEKARAAGASRFCMGAAWRDAPDDARFARVLDMVRGVKALGLETCATLGMLDETQAQALRDAGLDYYNHNLDTSREYYGEVITTRTYDERLDTLAAAREGGLRLCCGGIVGMGEGPEDRVGLLHELALQDPQPESVPINALVAVPGTPLGDTPPVDWDVLVRTVATARICLPGATVRLSAGRTAMTEEAQALCFLAGAGSIFLGDRLLTTPNPETSSDLGLLAKLGLAPQPVEHR